MYDSGEYSRNETNGYRSGRRLRDVGKGIGDKIASDRHTKEDYQRKLENYNRNGKGEFVLKGTDDRVAGLEYQGYSLSEGVDRSSYDYGYFQRGGVIIQGKVWKLEKEGKYEEAANIGYLEYTLGITEEKLGKLKEYESYMEGYNRAKKEGKRR